MPTRRKPVDPLAKAIAEARKLHPDDPRAQRIALGEMLVVQPDLIALAVAQRPDDFDESTLTNEASKEWRALLPYLQGKTENPPPIFAFVEFNRAAIDKPKTKTAKAKAERKPSERSASPEEIDAYLDALLTMPEYAHVGWTFALRLMRVLGKGSAHIPFRERFEAAQQRNGVQTERAKPTKVAKPEPEQPEAEVVSMEAAKRARKRTTKAAGRASDTPHIVTPRKRAPKGGAS